MEAFLTLLMFVVALFLIVLVLVQRGRGGGLAGALGGMGGQSAFGTKAGDIFTKVTMWTAAVWILLCVVTVKYMRGTGDPTAGAGFGVEPATQTAPATPGGDETPASGPTEETPAPGGAPAGAGREAPATE